MKRTIASLLGNDFDAARQAAHVLISTLEQGTRSAVDKGYDLADIQSVVMHICNVVIRGEKALDTALRVRQGAPITFTVE